MESIIFIVSDKENNREYAVELEPCDGEIYEELTKTKAYSKMLRMKEDLNRGRGRR